MSHRRSVPAGIFESYTE